MDLAKKILGRILKEPSGLSLNRAFSFQAIVKGTKRSRTWWETEWKFTST